MPRIIPIHWRKFEKFLFYIGCKFISEVGDHRKYHRDGLKRPIIITRDKQLPVFIVRNNLRNLNISHEEYIEILNKI